MHWLTRWSAVVFVVLLGGAGVFAQSVAAVERTARVSGDFRAGKVTRLRGHVPRWANAGNDLGALAESRRLELHLLLARSPEVEAAFEQLLADQQNPASARYRKWLTPKENAAQYGIAAGDLAAVTGWLVSKGLSVDGVGGGGLFVAFSGPVSAIKSAFSIDLRRFGVESSERYGPTTEPEVPAALAGVIQSVTGLTEEMAHVQSRMGAVEREEAVRPLFTTSSGSHYLSPGDFNAIYGIAPTLHAGINGSGMRVANLIDSRIAAGDVTGFNSVFGLGVAQPNEILIPGQTDPGLSSGSEGEAVLDVQRILGTAPGAAVDLLVVGSLSLNNIYSALQYEVGTLNDPIVNMSFGACNSGSSTSQSQAFDSYFKAGAAQGISFFVSSGDNAAAGCDAGSSTVPATQVLATNLICASSYATCVGGTQFAEGPGSYWAGSNSAGRVSATGYIPEGAWDEPTVVSSSGKTSYQASGTGGGVTNFVKPSWQAGAGVPADGVRDVPDVSFTSSYHDGYLICQADAGNDCSTGTFKYVTFGTSAAAPAMAGIAALLGQKLGGRQGSLNPLFYKLAAAPANGVFHDVTVASSGVVGCSTTVPSICNNSTPSSTALTGGLAGYAVGDGYDLATGLGSMDVTNFLAAAAPAAVTTVAMPSFTVSAGTGLLSFASGATAGNVDSIAVTSVNGFAGTVALSCSVSPAGTSDQVGCTVTPASVVLGAVGAATSVATISTTAQASAAHAALEVGGGAMLAMLIMVPFRRRRAMGSLAAVMAVFGVMGVASGCGSGGSLSSPATTLSSARTYTVTVTGTGTSVGSGTPVTASTTFTVSVN